MAKECKGQIRGKIRGKRTKGELDALSTIEAIKALTNQDARDLESEEGLTQFLKSWWSRHYKKPLKDPILETYTLYDLLYEYYDKIERIAVSEELIELEADKIEIEKENEGISWAEEEERKEREAEEVRAAEEEAVKAQEEQWMLEKLKAEHGSDFGENISTDFKE